MQVAIQGPISHEEWIKGHATACVVESWALTLPEERLRVRRERLHDIAVAALEGCGYAYGRMGVVAEVEKAAAHIIDKHILEGVVLGLADKVIERGEAELYGEDF